MTSTDVTPIPGDTWDDTDHVIYDLRIRQHKSLRGVAAEVNLHHEIVRRRLNRMMRKISHAEVEEMRTTEGHRLDELAAQHFAIIEAAILAEDLETAQRGLREIHALTRTRNQLFGLDTPTGRTPEVDTDRINELMGAYLAGHNDAKETA